jgi:restriction endonuclease
MYGVVVCGENIDGKRSDEDLECIEGNILHFPLYLFESQEEAINVSNKEDKIAIIQRQVSHFEKEENFLSLLVAIKSLSLMFIMTLLNLGWILSWLRPDVSLNS